MEVWRSVVVTSLVASLEQYTASGSVFLGKVEGVSSQRDRGADRV